MLHNSTLHLSLPKHEQQQVLRFLAHELGLSLPAFVDPDQPRGAMF